MTRADAPRTVLLTTGLRPVALAFPALPGRPVGIVRWDALAAFGEERRWSRWRESAPARRAIAALRRRRYASLAHLAAANGLAYAEIDKRRPERLAAVLERWRADLVVTSGCAMVPLSALRGLGHGALNVHPSPLPAYRGADPLLHQVADGVVELGVTVHRLAAGSDTGDIVASARLPRPRAASRAALTDATEGALGVPLLHRIVAGWPGSLAGATPQPERSPTRYARAVPPGRIAETFPLDSLDAARLHDLVCLLGECPPGWLAPRGWRARFRWRAWRVESREPGTGGTAEDAAEGTAAGESTAEGVATGGNGRAPGRDGWARIERGALLGLRRGTFTLWLRPGGPVRHRSPHPPSH